MTGLRVFSLENAKTWNLNSNFITTLHNFDFKVGRGRVNRCIRIMDTAPHMNESCGSSHILNILFSNKIIDNFTLLV
jgi:hypothetical protein